MFESVLEFNKKIESSRGSQAGLTPISPDGAESSHSRMSSRGSKFSCNSHISKNTTHGGVNHGVFTDALKQLAS